jgi:hypothetical protein
VIAVFLLQIFLLFRSLRITTETNHLSSRMKISFDTVCKALKINPAEQRDAKRRKSSGIWSKSRQDTVWNYLGETSARSSLGVEPFNPAFRRSALGVRIDRGIKRLLTETNCDTVEIETKPPKRARSHSLTSTAKRTDAENEQEVVDDLRKQIFQLEKEKGEMRKQIEEVRTFFHGMTVAIRENNSGRKKIFTAKTDAAILRMLSAGVSGRGISTVLQVVADFLPSIFDGQCSTPSVSYVNKMRGVFPTLARLHMQKFVQDSLSLTLHMDGFPCRAGLSFFGIGLSDEEGKFVAVEFAPLTVRKNAKNLKQAVDEILTQQFDDLPSMKSKVMAIMSDSEHTQRKANKLIIESVFNKRHLVEFPCSLHGASGLEKKTLAAMAPETNEILHTSKILFGSRLNSGYRRFSLKPALQASAGKTRRNDASIFQTDSGSRVHVAVNNAKNIIKHEQNVRLCLSSPLASNKPHAKKLHATMKHADWPIFKGELAFIALMWRAVCNPMFTTLSRPQPRKI